MLDFRALAWILKRGGRFLIYFSTMKGRCKVEKEEDDEDLDCLRVA